MVCSVIQCKNVIQFQFNIDYGNYLDESNKIHRCGIIGDVIHAKWWEELECAIRNLPQADWCYSGIREYNHGGAVAAGLAASGAAVTAGPALATGTNSTILRAGQSVARIPAREASGKEKSELSTKREDTRCHEKR